MGRLLKALQQISSKPDVATPVVDSLHPEAPAESDGVSWVADPEAVEPAEAVRIELPSDARDAVDEGALRAAEKQENDELAARLILAWLKLPEPAPRETDPVEPVEPTSAQCDANVAQPAILIQDEREPDDIGNQTPDTDNESAEDSESLDPQPSEMASVSTSSEISIPISLLDEPPAIDPPSLEAPPLVAPPLVAPSVVASMSDDLTTANDRAEPLDADEVHKLRDAILENRSGEAGGLIGLVSAGPLPERSELVAQLAEALADANERGVVAVDAGLGERQLAEHLGVPPGSGWLDVDDKDAVLDEVIAQTTTSGLRCLRVGKGPNASQTPARSALESLFDRCRQRDELVVADLGPSHESHVGPLARLCDEVYLVVGLGNTQRQSALDAIDYLQQGGVPLRGCIVCGPEGDSLQPSAQHRRLAA